ncbi:MAG: tetratricopeptide repeat protein, partial [Acidobacteria bacterium]|nr:tetratricopeptide repeat protein [Acidobacteriota bacterium]
HRWLAEVLTASGQLEEAREEMEMAAQLDSLSLESEIGLAWEAIYARRYDDAIERCEAILARSPDSAAALELLARALALTGRTRDAEARLDQRLQLGETAALQLDLAWVKALSGDREGTQHLLRSLVGGEYGYVPPYRSALVHLALGEPREALRLLRDAAEARDYESALVLVDPRIDALRSDLGFQEIVRLSLAPPAEDPAPTSEAAGDRSGDPEVGGAG